MAEVLIPAGVYSSYSFSSGNRYVGAGAGKTFIRNFSTAPFSYSAKLENLADIWISGVTFDGNGIYLGNLKNVQFSESEVTNARRTSGNHQGTYWTGLRSVTFKKFTWYNCSHAVMGYGSNDVLLEDCVTERCGYGTKIQLGNGARNLTIRRGIYRRIQASMGIEIQGDDPDIDGILVEDCAYVEPILNDDDSKNQHAFAWSLPGARYKNVLVHRCYVDGTDTKGRVSTTSWRGVRLAHEVGGTRPVHTQNWVRNLNDPGAITTSTEAQCFNNRVENCLEPWNFGSPANGSLAQIGSRVEYNEPDLLLPETGGWTLVGVDSGAGTDPIPPDPPVDDLEKRVAALEAAQKLTDERLADHDQKFAGIKSAL